MKIVPIIIFSLLMVHPLLGQEIEAVTKDGRTVILRQDGRWEYKPIKSSNNEKNTALVESKAGSPKNPLSSFDKKSPFDDFDTKNIPPSFLGHDIEEIFGILEKRFARKDEFETTVNYNRRISEASETPIYENLPLNGQLSIFRRGERYDDGIRYILTYSADKEVMTVELRVDNVLTRDTATLSMRDRNLRFINLDSFLDKYKTFSFEFNISAEKARELKKNLGLLYIFELKPLTSVDRYIDAELKEIWLVKDRDLWNFGNHESGSIEYKLKLSSIKTKSK